MCVHLYVTQYLSAYVNYEEVWGTRTYFKWIDFFYKTCFTFPNRCCDFLNNARFCGRAGECNLVTYYHNTQLSWSIFLSLFKICISWSFLSKQFMRIWWKLKAIGKSYDKIWEKRKHKIWFAMWKHPLKGSFHCQFYLSYVA